MKINSISVGGWFQRTTLQLSEIYDFLRGEAVQVKLETKSYVRRNPKFASKNRRPSVF